MPKIKRISHFFRILFLLLFITLPVLLILEWINAPNPFVILAGVIKLSSIPLSYSNSILHTLTPAEKLLGFCISTVPLSIALYILHSLIKLFKLYESGEIFSINHVRYIRNIGYGLLATQIINPLYEGLMGVILTWHNPHGHRFASISLDQTNIGMIVGALLVILISWIMAEGYRLQEEQQLTI